MTPCLPRYEREGRCEAFVIFPHDPTIYLLAAATLIAFSGVPGLVLNQPVWGQRIAAFFNVVASFLGEFAVIALLSGSPGATYQID